MLLCSPQLLSLSVTEGSLLKTVTPDWWLQELTAGREASPSAGPVCCQGHPLPYFPYLHFLSWGTTGACAERCPPPRQPAGTRVAGVSPATTAGVRDGRRLPLSAASIAHGGSRQRWQPQHWQERGVCVYMHMYSICLHLPVIYTQSFMQIQAQTRILDLLPLPAMPQMYQISQEWQDRWDKAAFANVLRVYTACTQIQASIYRHRAVKTSQNSCKLL